MAVFRCKMCGGDLTVTEGASSCVCEFCGTTQTIPTVRDEGLQTLFNRANVLRMKSEFDKASELYEKILQKNDQEAEAYWGLILCKYGIEYVEDPNTFKRIPTCHRASYDAVVTDEDYRSAIKYADVVQRDIYEKEAKMIDEIQKGIVELAKQEAPYDIFICYKETDESGRRTQDSVIANDIYYQLKHEGYKVFYAAITLEDKLGKEYEPYIFSALNSAKVMLALGTKPEYFQAVWVKNEWSRFLKIMKKDRSKMLIPCYRDMDAYELPEEFAHLQAQDMSKIGFINDLVRGIKKVVVKEEPAANPVAVNVQAAPVYSANEAALLKRGNMALEDKEWDKADGFFEEVLNLDAECAEAYLGKLLAAEKASSLEKYIEKKKNTYSDAKKVTKVTVCEEDIKHIDEMVKKYAVPGYLEEATIREAYKFDRWFDSKLDALLKRKKFLQAILAQEKLLVRALEYAKGETKEKLEQAQKMILESIQQRVDEERHNDEMKSQAVADAYRAHIGETDQKVQEMHKAAVEHREKRKREQEALELAKKREEEIKARKKKRLMVVGAGIVATGIAAFLLVTNIVIPNNQYKAALTLKENGQYEEAIKAFEELDDYKDSAEQLLDCTYEKATALMEEEAYVSAAVWFQKCSEYKDSEELKASVIELAGGQDYIDEEIAIETIIETMRWADVGDKVQFGLYEQDNNKTNGKEDVEWRVLAKEADAVLVISEYGLDTVPYHKEYKDTTWQECSLRTWLNYDFLKEVFTEAERERIKTSNVTAEKNPKYYSTSAGEHTQDHVFLLSISEVEKYFASEEDRRCKPTAYAIAQGAHVGKDGNSESNCFWWLRTPGDCSSFAAGVYESGKFCERGNGVDADSECVRPAMWIDLKS